MTEQRLPTVNADDGAWGDILNQYISKEHYNTGVDNAANGGHKAVTLQAGTATAGTAPLKFTTGTLLGTPEAGAIEFNADAFYGTATTGTSRKKFAFTMAGTVGTAAATAAKEVTITGYTPAAGDLICITYTLGSSVASPTLSINGGTAIAIQLNGAAATTINHTIDTGGQVIYSYCGTYLNMMGSQKTTDSDTLDRTQLNGAATAGTTIYRYKLLMQKADGKFYPLTLEDGTGTTKTVSTEEFLINSVILFRNSVTTANPDGTLSGVNLYSEYPLTVLNYTANQTTWTDQMNLYLKGTITATGGFKLDNTSATSWLTQTLPTTDDGFVYVKLGYMSATTAIKITQDHPMYQYKNGIVQPYAPPSYDMQLNPAPADHTYSGIKVSLVAGENITSGQVCYLKSDGNMWLAKADAEATAGTCMIALATAAISSSASGIFLLKGFFQDASVYNMTPCKPQFISAATGGAITETAPATATNIVRIIGYSKTADIIYFDPDKTYLEI